MVDPIPNFIRDGAMASGDLSSVSLFGKRVLRNTASSIMVVQGAITIPCRPMNGSTLPALNLVSLRCAVCADTLGRLVRPWVPRSSTQDMQGASRQISVRDDDQRYHIVAGYFPGKGWLFEELGGLAFGLGAAVLEFNRCPDHVVAVARRWLALPIINFYDDYRTLDVACSGGSVNCYFAHLNAWHGWLLDPDKHQSPSLCIRFLGVFEEFPAVGSEDFVLLYLDEARGSRLLALIDSFLSSRFASPSEISHLVGNPVHFSSTISGRIRFGMLTSLADQCASVAPRFSDAAYRD